MSLAPSGQRILRQEYADRISQLAVRSHIKNELLRRSRRIFPQRWPFADEIVLIDISLSAGIRLQASNWLALHPDIIERSERICREAPKSGFLGALRGVSPRARRLTNHPPPAPPHSRYHH